jgi:hypothetical protein
MTVLAEPLELLTSHRIIFHDTMQSFLMTLKLQITDADPLDLQLVVDLMPKTFLTGRGTKFARPQPKAYMHLRVEDLTSADELALTALAVRLILQNRGRAQGRLELGSQVKAWFENMGQAVAEAAYYGLETIQRHEQDAPEK